MVVLRLAGMGFYRICQSLNTEGYPSPKGRGWQEPTVSRWLSDFGIGTLEGYAYFNGHLPADDPERVVISNVYPPVIDAETATALRAFNRRIRQVSPGRNTRVLTTTNLCSGLLKCSFCGGSLSVNGTADFRCYRCCRAAAGVHEETVYLKIGTTDDAVLRVAQFALVAPPAARPQAAPVVRDKGRSREQIEAEKRQLLSLHLRGIIAESDFAEMYRNLERELSHIKTVEAQEDEPSLQSMARATAVEPAATETERLRQIVLLAIESAVAPVTLPSLALRGGKPRRCVRVRLRSPILVTTHDGKGATSAPAAVEEFIAPIYRTTYQGYKELYAWMEGAAYPIVYRGESPSCLAR